MGPLNIGDKRNIVVAESSSTDQDLSGAQGEGGSLAFVYQSFGAGIVVEHAMASINMLGSDCTFAAHLNVVKP